MGTGGSGKERQGGQTAARSCSSRTTTFFSKRDLPVEEVAAAGNDDRPAAIAAAPRRAWPRAARRRRLSPWMTSVSAGTAGSCCFSVDGPTSTSRRGRSPRREPRRRLRRDVAAEREAGQQHGRPANRAAAQCGDHGQRVVDLAAAFVPGALRGADAAEVEAHAAPAESARRRAPASARPCCPSCRRAADAGGRRPRRRAARRPGGRSRTRSRPAGPATCSRTVRRVSSASRRSAADVGRQQQALDDLAVLQVRVDDLVDVVAVDVGVPDRLRDRPPPPARRRSGRGSPPC